MIALLTGTRVWLVAGHLRGRAGLIRLLEQAGYRIETFTLPANSKQGK